MAIKVPYTSGWDEEACAGLLDAWDEIYHVIYEIKMCQKYSAKTYKELSENLVRLATELLEEAEALAQYEEADIDED